jgi:hypothetical protein
VSCNTKLTKFSLTYLFYNFKLVKYRIISDIFKIILRFQVRSFFNLIGFSFWVCTPKRRQHSFFRTSRRSNSSFDRLMAAYNRSSRIFRNDWIFIFLFDRYWEYSICFLIRFWGWRCNFNNTLLRSFKNRMLVSLIFGPLLIILIYFKSSCQSICWHCRIINIRYWSMNSMLS